MSSLSFSDRTTSCNALLLMVMAMLLCICDVTQATHFPRLSSTTTIVDGRDGRDGRGSIDIVNDRDDDRDDDRDGDHGDHGMQGGKKYPAPFDPQGPHKIHWWNEGSYLAPLPSEGLSLRAWSPMEPGSYPLVIFLTGFGGDIPVSWYTDFLAHIASYGYVVVGCDRAGLGPVEYPKFEELLVWMRKWLSTAMAKQGLKNVHARQRDTILASHSGGGYSNYVYLNRTCGDVKAMVLLDPVGYLDAPKPFNFLTPTLHLETGLDPLGFCAPQPVSNEVFYAATQAPIWQINSTAYGHGDFMNPSDAINAAAICKGTKLPRRPYRLSVGAVIVAFLRYIMIGDDIWLPLFQSPGTTLPIHTISKHKNLSLFGGNFTGGFCRRNT